MRRVLVLAVLLLASALVGASSTSVAETSRASGASAGSPNAPDGRGSPEQHDDGDHDHGEADGHAGDEGVVLGTQGAESVDAGGSTCSARAPVRSYDVVAMPLDITLNRYGHHDVDGRAYVLATELDAVRDAAAAGAEAVSLGLQGDAIQPLVLRVTPRRVLASAPHQPAR
ncbi:MAG: hypothetical protein M3P53_01345 [Actinomycetota bacterium]|nr:hypothetical protein [Actinomycetota bacterium]